MASITDLKLNLMSMNVRGIRNLKKRRALFYQFKKGKYDIICLQETHLGKNYKDIISREWGADFHIAEGTSHSKGMLTLFSNKIKSDDIKVVIENDRCIVSILTINNVKLAVINVYCPCIVGEKNNFQKKIKSTVEDISARYSVKNMAILGDFNIVKNNELDIISGNPHPVEIVENFNNTINELLFIDVWRDQNKHKKEFTWSSKNPFTARRLDYIFVSPELLPFSYQASIKTIGFSDHRAVTLLLDFASFKRGPGTYKLNIKLLHNVNFVKEVKSEIKDISNCDLDPHLKWESIKLTIKNLGMAYGRSMASENNYNKKKLYTQLEELEHILAKTPTDITAQQRYTSIKQQIEIISIAETDGARIRAGLKWAEEGEKCSKYFLNLEKQRSNNNTIFKLVKNDNKEVLTTNDDILKEIAEHFSSLYTCKNIQEKDINEDCTSIFLNPSNVVSINDEDKNSLNLPLSEREIFLALKSTKNGSSPGLDGIPGEVYKFFWNDIKIPLLNCYNHSFEIGELSTSQTQGVICLLHKGKGSSRDDISNWRPIALTNFDYKLIAKVLARRLTSILDTIIDNDQHAFIKGRNIANMLREIDDIIELGKAENSKSFILSIDYAKAFDSISIDAILRALKYYDLGNELIKWISIILNKRVSCIRNAGYLSYFFNMDRGVRQGCPLSPLLFILTAELFARSIRFDPNIAGINFEYPRPVKIRQFADDTTLFLRDMIDYREVLVKIKAFAIFTGLHMNKNKSFAMYISDPSHDNTIKFGIRFVNKIKILGVSFSNIEKVHGIMDNFDTKIEQLKRLCYLWSKRNLSIIGKITILKTFGLSLFTYIMQSIGIPVIKLNEVNKICFRFIWNKHYSDKRAFEKVKRKTLCSPKENGGVNMFNIVDIQDSYYFQWANKLWDNSEEHWKVIPKFLFHKLGGIYAFASNVQPRDFKGLNLLRNVFWEKVLWVWLDHKSKFHDTQNLTLGSPLFNNSLIRFKNQTIFIPHCCQQSIIKVGDVLENRKIVDLERFTNIYGARSDTVIAYNIIFNALYTHIETFARIYSNKALDGVLEIASQDASLINRKQFLTLINIVESPVIETFWIKKLQPHVEQVCLSKYNINMSTFWMLPYNVTKEIRLITLQWKIIQNIYPTSILLEKMKIKSSAHCEHCKVLDTLEHFFFDCSLVKSLWADVERKIATDFGRTFKFGAIEVILGITSSKMFSKKDLKRINLILLVSKLCISKFKYGKNYCLITLFEHELRFRHL